MRFIAMIILLGCLIAHGLSAITTGYLQQLQTEAERINQYNREYFTNELKKSAAGMRVLSLSGLLHAR